MDCASTYITSIGSIFAFRVDDAVVSVWTKGVPGQTVGQAEVLPIVVARKYWASRISGMKVFHFIDDDAAREGLVKGSSDSEMSQELIHFLSYRS